MRLRLEVKRFAEEMEKTLRKNDQKSGWKGESYWWLMCRLREELEELRKARKRYAPPKEILHEVVDIANFAMMIADNNGDLLHGETVVDESKIDVDLRGVIHELNKVGLRTTQCCSGHSGEKKAYISIDLSNVEDVGIREHGKRLVIWWSGPKPTKKRKDGE